jgi:deoxyinosine 3'endonuclease (endonuclease V)
MAVYEKKATNGAASSTAQRINRIIVQITNRIDPEWSIDSMLSVYDDIAF